MMRRDKTLKLCANHVVKSWMELKPNCGSDRAFVWSVHADYADEEPKAEVLAIKFANAENAAKFKYGMNDDCEQVFCSSQYIFRRNNGFMGNFWDMFDIFGTPVFRAAFVSAVKEMTAVEAGAYKQREAVDRELAAELEKKAEIAEK